VAITPEYQVVVTHVKDLRAGDRVIRRATTPQTGKMSVDIVSRIQEAPPSRKKIMAGGVKDQGRSKRGEYMEITWNDDKKNVSFHHTSDELLLVTTFVEQDRSSGRSRRTKKRFAWQ